MDKEWVWEIGCPRIQGAQDLTLTIALMPTPGLFSRLSRFCHDHWHSLDVPWQSFPSRSDLATSRIDTFPATSARHFVKTTHALHYSSLQSSIFVLHKFIPCFCPSPSSKQANTVLFSCNLHNQGHGAA